MKTIITGVCGFLGSRLAQAFIDAGDTVFGFDCVDTPPLQNALFTYFKCDIEKNIFPPADQFYNPDLLIHFAWNGVRPEYRNDYNLQTGNITSLLNILPFAKKINVKKMMIPGSASEYAASEMPINGMNKQGAVDAYGAVKSACHVIAQTWARGHRLPLIWVIPSSIYGPGRNDGNILTYAIKTLLERGKPSFTALEQRWDYIYTGDFIRAFMLAARKGVPGKTYALGYGQSRELREYITVIRDLIDPSLPLGIGEIPYKNGKPDNSEIDISSLQNDTGFEPAFSFEEGIRLTVDWFAGAVSGGTESPLKR